MNRPIIATKTIKEPAACQNNQVSAGFEFGEPTSCTVRARKVCQGMAKCHRNTNDMKGSKVPENTQHNLHVWSVFELSRYMPDHSRPLMSMVC